jgi:hypothetical protein
MMTRTAEYIPPGQVGADLEAALEEAQRSGLGALAGASPRSRSVLVWVGAKFTTAVSALGEHPQTFRVLRHGPVLLAASQAEAASANAGAVARVIRAAAQQVAERARMDVLRGFEGPIVGTAGIARAVITLGAGGRPKATVEQIRGATELLAGTWVSESAQGRPHDWVVPLMVGSAVLAAILEHLGATEIGAEAEVGRDPQTERD